MTICDQRFKLGSYVVALAACMDCGYDGLLHRFPRWWNKTRWGGTCTIIDLGSGSVWGSLLRELANLNCLHGVPRHAGRTGRSQDAETTARICCACANLTQNMCYDAITSVLLDFHFRLFSPICLVDFSSFCVQYVC